jgi:hypothetical protein
MGRYWGFQEGNVYVTTIASIHYYIACFVKSYGCKIKAMVSRITQHFAGKSCELCLSSHLLVQI